MDDGKRSGKGTWIAVAALIISSCAAAYTLSRSTGSAAGGPAAASRDTLAEVRRSQKVKAGYIKYPPFVTYDEKTGALSGYFIELMDAIAKEGGFEVTYEETSWATMVTGLRAGGKFDVVVSGIFSTVPRAMEVTFCDPVLFVGLSAIARKGDDRFKTVDDLKRPGLVVAVTSGEVGHEYARKFLPDAKLIVVQTEDISRPMLDVTANRADIALGDSMTCYRFARAHPEVKDVFADDPFYVFGTSLMVRRGDQDREWKDFLNIALEHLELSGVTDRLEAKYKEGSSAWISKRKPWK